MSDGMHLFEFQATSGVVEYSDELRRWAYGSGLELGEGDIVRYVGKGAHGTDVGAMQTLEPMRSSCHVHYYELQILREGKTGRVSVGFAESGFKLNRHCGWEEKSFGYHGDDGKKFSGLAAGNAYGPTFGLGDIVGAGLNLISGEIFFTKNGVWLGTAFKTTNVTSPLFPTVGIHSKGESVKVNLGTTPFAFNIKDYIFTESKKRSIQISSENTTQLLTHELIRDFLFSHGYSSTLAALDLECRTVSARRLRAISTTNTLAEGCNVGLRAKLRLVISSIDDFVEMYYFQETREFRIAKALREMLMMANMGNRLCDAVAPLESQASLQCAQEALHKYANVCHPITSTLSYLFAYHKVAGPCVDAYIRMHTHQDRIVDAAIAAILEEIHRHYKFNKLNPCSATLRLLRDTCFPGIPEETTCEDITRGKHPETDGNNCDHLHLGLKIQHALIEFYMLYLQPRSTHPFLSVVETTSLAP